MNCHSILHPAEDYVTSPHLADETAWSAVTSKPTTLSGYGITDAKIASGVITFGSKTITPLTQHQDISGKVDKAPGMGLSSNDYTDDEKVKLSDIAAGATASQGTVTSVVPGTGLAAAPSPPAAPSAWPSPQLVAADMATESAMALPV